jgi:hypothetical protein
MASFYVDDHFPEHPKAVAAGDDACWLFVCGLAYVHRNKTVTIPKAVAHRLVTKSGARLAQRLCEVNLWHDRGTHYEIHDYETRNAKSIAKSAQTRRAAEIRWERVAAENRADTTSTASSPPPDDADASAFAMRSLCVRTANADAEPMHSNRSIQLTKYPSIQSSSPYPSSHADESPSDDPKTEGMKSNLRPHLQPLVERWVSICDPKSQLRVRNDAPPVIAHLLGYLDAGVIDECIGICAERSTSPPKSAKYLLQTCREFAARNLPGMLIPDLTATATA